MPKVSVYTQVYNAGIYLEPCIASVLAQTYSDFEYIIVDSASTDGSLQVVERYATGEYYTVLDHDDWWEPDYLEHLLHFAETNHLDIACTGTCMHHMTTGKVGFRKLEQPLILQRNGFPMGFPYYHQFFRTTWGKLVRSSPEMQIHQEDISGKVSFGSDTIYCFQLLRRAKRIGIDSSVLHHYRIHAASQSYRYRSGRFESDVYRYQDAENFLLSFGNFR